MLKLGQDLPFDSKTTQSLLRICASLENFDRDTLLELSVGTFGEINGPHTAAPEFSYYHVRAEPLAGSIAFVASETLRCEVRKLFQDGRILGKQLFSFTKKRRVICACFSERCCPLFNGGLFQRVCKNILEALPARRI